MKVNEKLWCQFIKGKKAIVTETQEEFNKLMEIIDATTYFRWGGSGDPIKSCPNYWDVYKENTTIERWSNSLKCIYYGNKNIYTDKIDFKDLFSKEEVETNGKHFRIQIKQLKNSGKPICLVNGKLKTCTSFCKECSLRSIQGDCPTKFQKWCAQPYKEEEKMQVLDDVEKKYIGNIIAPKPIYNSVKFIIKERSLFSPLDKERIEIIYKDGSSLHTCLPDFATGTMYRGMEIDQRYTLKALGL